VLAVTRYRVPVEEAESFRDQAATALAALAARPGCLDGRVGRAVDDPTVWVLATTWESIGTYRRALGNHDVKLHAVPLMYRALDEPTAFEDLATWSPDGAVTLHDTARAADADDVALGEAATSRAPRDLR
jgi:quinol monooxygenase YgiN